LNRIGRKNQDRKRFESVRIVSRNGGQPNFTQEARHRAPRG